MHRKWMQMIALLGSFCLLAGVMLFAKNKSQKRVTAYQSGTSETTQSVSTTTPTTASTSIVTAVPTTSATTSPTTIQTQPEDPRVQLAAEYEAYIALSPEEQQAYFLSFSSYEDFFEWFHTVKDAYEALQDRIEIGGDGNVDIGDLIEGNK